MAKQLIKNYAFNASSKTVTLTDFSAVVLERLQLIVDTTTNTILYNFADSSVTTASVSTNVVALGSVGSASSSDKLMVIYDSATGDPIYDGGQRTMANSEPVVIANDQSTLAVAGGKTNNDAAPGTNNVGILPVLANAATPSWSEGNQVAVSADLSGNQRVTLGTKLDNTNDSITTYPHGNVSSGVITSSQLLLTGGGHLAGIFVASASSTPTIKIWDATSATAPVLIDMFTPTAATMYTFPNVRVSNGIYITIGGTVDCTVFYDNFTA